MAAILVVEDELALGRQIARALGAHEVRSADCGNAALASLREALPDLVLLDLRLPDLSGLDVLSEIRRMDPHLPVVLMTAYSSVDDAVEAMRRGASDYLSKPLDLKKLRILVDSLMTRQWRDRELDHLRKRDQALPEGVVSQAEAIRRIFKDIDRLAEARLTPGERPAILLLGETGTGKGMAARAIHDRLGGGPFLDVNCVAVPGNLIEAELFGHEKGSFTDAKTRRTGLFEAAEGGTLFLDEIGHLPTDLQAKFLSVLEHKRVRRIGATQDRPVNVQVIAATNRDLEAAVREDAFRLDLFHRLSVLRFELPPLRERPDDVALIADHFCALLGRQYRGSPVTLSPEALARLRSYRWPGNVRELRNVIERAVLLGSGKVLEAEAFHTLTSDDGEMTDLDAFVLPDQGIDLDALEGQLIRQALARADGNQTRAAKLLGLTRHTFRYRLEKHGLD